MKFLYTISFEVKNRVPTGNWTHCKIQKYTFLVRCEKVKKRKRTSNRVEENSFNLKERDKSKVIVSIKYDGILENRSVQNWMPHNQRRCYWRQTTLCYVKVLLKLAFLYSLYPSSWNLGHAQRNITSWIKERTNSNIEPMPFYTTQASYQRFN